MADDIWNAYKNKVTAANNNALLPRRNLTASSQQAFGQANALMPRVTEAQNALIDLLSKRGTDQDRASLIGRRSGNLTSNYLNARSRIQAGMGGRLPNSMEAGQLANLEGSHATALSQLYNDADDTIRDQDMSNANALLALLSGARNNARGEWLNDTGLLQNLDQTALGNLGNLSQMDEARKKRKAEEAQQWLQSLAAVGQAAGAWA